MEILAIIAAIFIISVMRDSRDQKARVYRSTMLAAQVKREKEQLHGSNKLDQYHWTGEYKAQKENESSANYIYTGEPPIWEGDVIRLVWYFDKIEGSGTRVGHFNSYYRVSNFEEYFIDWADVDTPIRKRTVSSTVDNKSNEVLEIGDRVHIYQDYKDGRTRSHQVVYDGFEYRNDGKRYYYFKYRHGKIKRYGIEEAGLEYILVDKIIGLEKLSNSEKKYGIIPSVSHPDIWLDREGLYFRLTELRDIRLHDYWGIAKRVEGEKKITGN
jgi:hypothetical protein